MNKKYLPMIAAAAALLVILAAAGVFLLTHVRIGFRFYPKGRETLEISETMTPVDFRTLRSKLPDTEIICEINFNRDTIPSTVEEITITRLSRNDIPFLRSLPNLKVIHAEDCIDYAPLEYLTNRLPRCKVYYGVEVNGVYYDQDTESIYMPDPDLEVLDKLEHLPKLKSLDITGCKDVSKLTTISTRYPQWQIIYTISLCGQEIPSDVQELELENARYWDLKSNLPFMPKLKKLKLLNPSLKSAEYESLVREYIDIDFSSEITIAGTTLDDTIEELDLTDQVFTDISQIEEIMQSAAYAPALKKVVVDSGFIPNVEMLNVRTTWIDSCELVWTVPISSKISLRTDVTSFSPKDYGENSFVNSTSENLVFCLHMEALNLSGISMRNVNFLKGMPNLRYLDLSSSQIYDMSGLSDCRKLVMLNLANATAKNVKALPKCVSLEDLNISNTNFGVEPVVQMPWLKNLYAISRSANVLTALNESLTQTTIVTDSGTTWNDLPNYHAFQSYFTK